MIKPLSLEITGSENTGKKKKKRGIKKVLFVAFIILLVVIFLGKNSSTSSVFRYMIGQGSSLQSEDGRVNVLLLGMAGGEHEGATLTDTIMVLSFDSVTNMVSMVSIPRDLYLTSARSKVNALYEIGLARGDGLNFAEENFSQILGIKIPYAVRMDFSGFTKAIDVVGGIDVNVANTFDDYLYPIAGKETDYCGLTEKDMAIDEVQAKQLGIDLGEHRVLVDSSGKIATASATVGGQLVYTEDSVGVYFPCRYEHIHFDKGSTHMNGTMALKYVRSRHGTGGEGSDFARSRRQQLVLQAFKDKVLSFSTLTDLNKITGLVKTFGNSMETDIPESQYLEFAGIAKKVKGIKTMVLSNGGINPLLINPPVFDYGAWVLIPPNNDFIMIQNSVTDFFNGTDTATQSGKQTKNP
ncbi:MAG: LCP family protein [Microgenomates group bacterium]|jgi:LCP family protein required for cell wall assembly